MKLHQLMTIMMASALCSMVSGFAHATPVLPTICEDHNGQTSAWWPNDLSKAGVWTGVLKSHGIETIDPAKVANPPRLSPTVYGQKPLSSSNAKTMASLYGANIVLNGMIAYQCEKTPETAKCTAKADLTLYSPKGQETSYRREIQALAEDIDLAKGQIRTRIGIEIAPIVLGKTMAKQDIPKLIDKPVVLFSPMPDADTLVAIRKRLKRVSGVKDVSERFVVNGTLAIEINPDQAVLPYETFLTMMQAFISDTGDDFIVKESGRTESGMIVEIAKY